jgi:hypothetical protein
MALELPACVKKFINLWDERSQECIDFFMMFNLITLRTSIKKAMISVYDSNFLNVIQILISHGNTM